MHGGNSRGEPRPEGNTAVNCDLTVGKPQKVLLFYILPLLGSALFQQFYTLADTIIAGKFAGQTALTAIGASNSIVNILMAVALGANAGCAVLVSRYFGAKEHAKVRSAITTALLSFFVLSCVLLLAGVLSCEPVLQALKTPEAAMEDSVTYLNIYYYGLPFLILYNLGTGIFSALGDSKTPFLFLVASSLANIFLDWVMVKPWGVAGVAWATFLAQGAACILTLFFVYRRLKGFVNEEKAPLFSGTLLKTLLLLSIPVILQNSFVSVGNLVIQVRINELANAEGIGITSGFTSGFKLLVFSTTCFNACATGLTNYVSQNFGANKFHRIRQGFLWGLVISTALTACFVAVSMLAATPLVSLFMPGGEQDTALALQTGVEYIRLTAPFFFVVNVKIMADATVRGCNGNVGFMVSTFSDLILRVVFVFLLTPFMGFTGVGWAWDIGWVLGTAIALAFYFAIPCLKKRNLSPALKSATLKSTTRTTACSPPPSEHLPLVPQGSVRRSFSFCRDVMLPSLPRAAPTAARRPVPASPNTS